MSRLIAVVATGATFLVACFLLFFRYQYVDSGGATDRVDRLTGSTCIMPCVSITTPTTPPSDLLAQRAISMVRGDNTTLAVLSSIVGAVSPDKRFEWSAIPEPKASRSGGSDDSAFLVCYCRADSFGYRWEAHLDTHEIFYVNDNRNLSTKYGVAYSSPSPSQTKQQRPTATDGAAGSISGAWEIDEANRSYGTIIWDADITYLDHGARIAMDARKRSIAGQSATECERDSHLYAAFDLSRDDQRQFYREVNCMGAKFNGYIDLTNFSRNRDSFSGSFWSDGTKQGDFSAHKV